MKTLGLICCMLAGLTSAFASVDDGIVKVECLIQSGETNVGQKIFFEQQYEWNNKFHPEDGFTRLTVPFLKGHFLPTSAHVSGSVKVEYTSENNESDYSLVVYFPNQVHTKKQFNAEAILMGVTSGLRASKLNLSCKRVE